MATTNIAKRVSLYARVSTLEKNQDPETQLRQLREYAQRRSFEILGEYVDFAPGASDARPRYQVMLKAARKRKIDVELVWRYNHCARSRQALGNALEVSSGQEEII